MNITDREKLTKALLHHQSHLFAHVGAASERHKVDPLIFSDCCAITKSPLINLNSVHKEAAMCPSYMDLYNRGKVLDLVKQPKATRKVFSQKLSKDYLTCTMWPDVCVHLAIIPFQIYNLLFCLWQQGA